MGLERLSGPDLERAGRQRERGPGAALQPRRDGGRESGGGACKASPGTNAYTVACSRTLLSSVITRATACYMCC